MISRGQDKQLGKDGMGRGEVEADEEKKKMGLMKRTRMEHDQLLLQEKQ